MPERPVGLLAALGAFLGGHEPDRGKRRAKRRDLTTAEKARNLQQRVRDLTPGAHSFMFGVRITRNKPKDDKARDELHAHLSAMAYARGSQAEFSKRWHGYTYATITGEKELKARRQARNARKRRSRAYRASRRRRDAA